MELGRRLAFPVMQGAASDDARGGSGAGDLIIAMAGRVYSHTQNRDARFPK